MRSFVALLLTVAVAHAAPPLDSVPDNAVVAGALRAGSLDLARGYFGQTAEMQRDLAAFFTRRLGIDLTDIDSAAFWSTQLGQGGQRPTFAAFLRMPKSTGAALKGKKRGTFDGAELIAMDNSATMVAAAVPGGLIVGDEAEVRNGIAVARRHAPALRATSPLGSLLQQDTAEVVAAMAPSAIQDPSVQLVVQQYGANLVTLLFGRDGRISLEVAGDSAKLKMLGQAVDATVKLLIGQLKIQHDRALSDDNMEFADGLGAVAGYGQAQAFWKEAAPRLDADKLVMRYQLPQLKSSGMVVPAIGIMAAIAIPAFNKYIRRSKTVEATMFIRRLADGAAQLASAVEPNKKNRFAFPRSTDWTPPASCCNQPGQKCAPNPKLWSGETFTALQFSIDDPFYYQYRVTSEGRGAKARITVEARGDLNCDQKTSSFKRTITLDDNGQPVIGPLQSADDLE